MAAPLSPKRLHEARRVFNIFNFFNSFSFVFVSGSFLTLFAIRLGASNAVVGILNAIGYATFFFMPVGKSLVRKKPIVWTFGWAWTARYIALIPVLFAPAAAASGHRGAALGLLASGAIGFAVFRGIALIGNNPVVAFLASGGGEKPRSDRGRFMITNSLINSVAGMAGGLVLAFSLGQNATPLSYALGVGAGIVTGLVGCSFLLKTPEPTDYMPSKSSSLAATTKEAMKDEGFRRFLTVFMLLAFISGMGRSFLPVYAKDVFAQGDDAVMVYSLLASLGSIAMGMLTRLIVDRLGSKPLFIIFSGVGLLSFLPIALFSGSAAGSTSGTVIVLLLVLVNFLSAFGFAGEENAGQTYYFSLVPREKTLDLSVIYYFAFGLGGAVGSGTGGLLLDLLSLLGLSAASSYRALYALLCLVLGITIFIMGKLKRLGSASVGTSLSVMFSFRDLKAFDLLSKLDRSVNPVEEIRLIQELGKSASTLSQKELLEYLASPRFEVRMEALLAFETMPTLSPQAVRPLMREVEHHTFTTAYVAARILGKHGAIEAIPILRKALEADDYLLLGTATIALARLGDRDSIALIESILMRSKNPRVVISATYALEIFDSVSSLPALASCLKQDDPPAFVSDEVVLAIASIVKIMEEFYPLYVSYIQDPDQGIALLESTARDVFSDTGELSEWSQAVRRLFDPREPDGAPYAAFLVRRGRDPAVEIVLGETLVDPRLCYGGMKFLAAAYPLMLRKERQTAVEIREER